MLLIATNARNVVTYFLFFAPIKLITPVRLAAGQPK